jgi:hypothetical protein
MAKNGRNKYQIYSRCKNGFMFNYDMLGATHLHQDKKHTGKAVVETVHMVARCEL